MQTHNSDTSLQQFNGDTYLKNTPNDTAKNMGGDYDDGEIDKDEVDSKVNAYEDNTIHDENDNQTTHTVNYAYEDDVFGRSMCMKKFFGLQKEMHHVFKSMIIENMIKYDIAGILPEPKIYTTFFTYHRK